MDIKQLKELVKKKILKEFNCEKLEVIDKTFLHVKHKSYNENRYHIKIVIYSNYLKKFNKIDGSKKIYKVLHEEIKKFIHSLELKIN